MVPRPYRHTRCSFHPTGPGSRVLATGGASSNSKILQVLADVFNAPVYTIRDTANSACLGCAYRAKHGLLQASQPFKQVVSGAPPYQLAVDPDPQAAAVYTALTARYKELEDSIVDATEHVSKKRKTDG